MAGARWWLLTSRHDRWGKIDAARPAASQPQRHYSRADDEQQVLQLPLRLQ